MRIIILTVLLFVGSAVIATAQEFRDFIFTDIDGEIHQLSDPLDQGYIVLLDFFYIDCPPCIESMHEFQDILTDYEGKNVVIISVSPYDTDEAIRDFAQHFGFQQLFVGIEGGSTGMIETYYEVNSFGGFPTVSVICPDRSVNWDIWPYSPGASEWRTAIETCGVIHAPPYAPQTVVSSTSNAVYGNPQISVVPNPSSGQFTVHNNWSNQTLNTCALFTLTGQKLLDYAPTRSAATGHYQIDAGHLPSGTYVLKSQWANEAPRSQLVQIIQ